MAKTKTELELEEIHRAVCQVSRVFNDCLTKRMLSRSVVEYQASKLERIAQRIRTRLLSSKEQG